MNNIVMIPVRRLKHHPENPRKDLGDLTELAESIKANGVMQNLTVVPELMDGTICTGRYLVVIGNRRMEAAKLAGLEELPCVVSDMDRKAQIATMLMENMQRADLTVYEQAQGFQMMMDLGFKPEEISEKTGFSETTVRRRLKMAELDGKILQKAVGKQITMDDLDRLAKVDSVKQRNALLKDYGENNYNWNVTRAIQVQESAKRKKAARQMLKDAKVEQLPEKDRYGSFGKYRTLYNDDCKLYEWDGKKNFIPKVKEGKLFYYEEETKITFYVKEEKKKTEAPEKTAEEKEEEKKRALAWKTVDRFAETAAELRKAFAEEMTVSPKNAMRMMQWALSAAFGCMMNYTTPTMAIKEKMGVTSHVIPEIIAEVTNKMMDLKQSKWPALILMMFEGDWEERKAKPPMFAEGSRGYQMPSFKRNVMLELCYTWLTEFGYQMSTEEIEMMSGTHAVFQTEVEA